MAKQFAKVTIGWYSYFLPVDQATKLFGILSQAVIADPISYRVVTLRRDLLGDKLEGKYVTKPDSYDNRITLELVSEMPMPHFDQEAEADRLQKMKDDVDAKTAESETQS